MYQQLCCCSFASKDCSSWYFVCFRLLCLLLFWNKCINLACGMLVVWFQRNVKLVNNRQFIRNYKINIFCIFSISFFLFLKIKIDRCHRCVILITWRTTVLLVLFVMPMVNSVIVFQNLKFNKLNKIVQVIVYLHQMANNVRWTVNVVQEWVIWLFYRSCYYIHHSM